MAERIARHNQDNALREHEENERVRRAVEQLKKREEFNVLREKLLFNRHLTILRVLLSLERIRDENIPDEDEDWNPYFRLAIEMIPTFRQFYEDTAMDCTEVKK